MPDGRTILTLLQDATATPPRLSPDQAGRTALLTFIVLVIGLFGLIALITINLIRRRHRDTQARLERDARAAAAAKPPLDPWAEAGRRVEAPAPDDLTETRVPIDLDPQPAALPTGRKGRPIAIVTGAARRVGRAIALELARAGCDVHFTYHASEEDAQQLARDLSAAGAEGAFFRLDLSDPQAVEAFARDRAEMLQHLDILVHNASTYDPSPIDEITAESAARQYRVNALAPLILTTRLAPLLRNSTQPGGAAVIALADIHAMGRPRKDFVAYAMSKAALVEMVHGLARDLAPQVRVNAIAPGVIAWPESGFEADPIDQARYVRRIPLARAGTPDDAAKVVRWLAFDATYITGEVIRVDGGRWLT